MTKLYDLIHLNGFIYMVDGKAKVKEWGIYDNFVGKLWFDAVKLGLSNDKESKTWDTLNRKSWFIEHNVLKIVASTDPFLDLPLLPEIEENVRALAEKTIPYVYRYNKEKKDKSDSVTDQYRLRWVEGYKAAKAKKYKYTEEDMLEAIVFGQQQVLIGKAYTPTDIDKEKFDQFLQSLNPLPTKVEVEMEENQCDGCKAELPLYGNIHKDHQTMGIACSKERYNKPRVVNNFVVVKRLIYDA